MPQTTESMNGKSATELPKTTGRWGRILRAGQVVAYVELFAAGGRWFSVPGASRIIIEAR